MMCSSRKTCIEGSFSRDQLSTISENGENLKNFAKDQGCFNYLHFFDFYFLFSILTEAKKRGTTKAFPLKVSLYG